MLLLGGKEVLGISEETKKKKGKLCKKDLIRSQEISYQSQKI
jgi:hypothetical protein